MKHLITAQFSDRLFFFTHPATPEIYTLSLHDALPIFPTVGTALQQLQALLHPGATGLLVLVVRPDAERLAEVFLGQSCNPLPFVHPLAVEAFDDQQDRKSTRLNSSHRCISYAVFCLKK